MNAAIPGLGCLIAALALSIGCGGSSPAPITPTDAGLGALDAEITVIDAGACVAGGQECTDVPCCGGLQCASFDSSPVACVEANGCFDDGVMNGAETGIDCGRTCARKCADGVGCHQGTDCLAGLYCARSTSRCAPIPSAGRSCGAGSSVITITGLRFSSDSADCSADEACFFALAQACVVWFDCHQNQVDCCDVGGHGGQCFPLGSHQPCTAPTGFCGDRPR